jgi:hypothetical protein
MLISSVSKARDKQASSPDKLLMKAITLPAKDTISLRITKAMMLLQLQCILAMECKAQVRR